MSDIIETVWLLEQKITENIERCLEYFIENVLTQLVFDWLCLAWFKDFLSLRLLLFQSSSILSSQMWDYISSHSGKFVQQAQFQDLI